MTITINGKAQELSGNYTLEQFLLTKDLDPNKIVVEYNGIIVKQQDWANFVLKENDCLEVLRFVGGG